jgi:amino acid permease
MGNGALLMPYIFSKVGYLIALSMLALNGILVAFSWMRLTDVLDYIPQDSKLDRRINRRENYTLIEAM